MLTRRELFQSAAFATFSTLLNTAPALAQTKHFGFVATTTMAEAGFIYGLPIVLSYAAMYEQAVDLRSGQFKASFNRIKHQDSVFTPKSAMVKLPNNDTLESVAWMDLRAEPIVLSIPAFSRERYHSVMLRDCNFYNYGYIGSRATGNEAGDYMIVGPGWDGEAPPTVKKIFRSSTHFSIALIRTQLINPDDIDDVKQVQAGYRLEPLSAIGHRALPQPVPNIRFQKISKERLRKNFFQHLAFALQLAPAQAIEQDARATLANLGVGPGKTFDFGDLSLKEKLEISLGIRAGDREIDRAIARSNTIFNGWSIAAYFGNSTFYSGNWLLRAAAAKDDFYGNDPLEAIVASARVDGDGKMLDGSKHEYTLSFEQGQFPPVNAFWSVSMYQARSKLLVRNPIDRYVVNSSMLRVMKTNANGSLTIYVQHRPPGTSKKANWLPAPNGPMLLVMRLYWPKSEPPSILPVGKGTWQPPSLKRL
jgi:hypothetical protein